MSMIKKYGGMRVPVLAFAALSLVMTACASKSSTGTGSGGGSATIAGRAELHRDAEHLERRHGPGEPAGDDALLPEDGQREQGHVHGQLRVDVAAVHGESARFRPRGSGVTGPLGTIATPSGGKQLTYMGWPLYTYSGDSAPGQANGQGSGGIWFAMTTSGPTTERRLELRLERRRQVRRLL